MKKIVKNQSVKNLKKGLFLIFFLMIFPASVFSQDQKKESPDESLATLIILPFENNTGSNDFEYMTNSLVEAVNTSISKNFQYKGIDYEKVTAAYKKLQFQQKQVYLKKGKELPADFALEVAREVSSEIGADVVVFGNYSFDKESNELIINTSLYLALVKSTRTINPTRNAVDNTIFQATEKVALNIVDEINQMVAESTGVKEEEVKTSERKAFTKTAAKIKEKTGYSKETPQGIFLSAESMGAARDLAVKPWDFGGTGSSGTGSYDPYSWSGKKFVFSVSGIKMGLGGTFEDNTTRRFFGNMIGLDENSYLIQASAKYFIEPGMYVGLNFAMDSTWDPNYTNPDGSNITFDSTDISALYGIGYPISIVFPFLEVSLGYCGSYGTNTLSWVDTLVLMKLRAGVEFLVLPFMSIGTSLDWRLYLFSFTSDITPLSGFDWHALYVSFAF